MKEWTCKDCKNFEPHGICQHEQIEPFPEMEICAHFETTDGKRPRFCRLAGSVNEMAELLIEETYEGDGICIYEMRVGIDKGRMFRTKKKAVDFAKAWLMEVEE